MFSCMLVVGDNISYRAGGGKMAKQSTNSNGFLTGIKDLYSLKWKNK